MEQNINVANRFFKNATYFFIFFLILLSTVGVGIAAASSPAASISPASQSVSAGSPFTIDVAVDPAGKGVSTGSITISFDASAMEADSVTNGDLLGTSPIPAPGYPKIDNTAGTVQVELSRFGTTTPPTAAGTWAAIAFTAKTGATAGTYNINLTLVSLADENFNDISGITLTNGTVKVTTGDTAPPAIEFISPTPADGGTVTVNYVNVTVNVTDATSGVSTVLLNWNGLNETMNIIGLNTWSVNKTGLASGEHTYKVYANDTSPSDNWGASGVRTVKVVVVTPTVVSIYPASQSVSAGSPFTVDVKVDPVGKGVSAGSVIVSFDATVMQVDSVANGDLLGTGLFVPPGYPKIDNTAGTVGIDLVRFGTTPVPTAAGTFATITFTAKTGATTGTYNINLTTAELTDESVKDISGITTTNGTVVVGVPGFPRWDINEDGKVDFKDLAILGAHYGETTVPPYPRYDINEDGKVDFKDLAILGAHYGETTPV